MECECSITQCLDLIIQCFDTLKTNHSISETLGEIRAKFSTCSSILSETAHNCNVKLLHLPEMDDDVRDITWSEP